MGHPGLVGIGSGRTGRVPSADQERVPLRLTCNVFAAGNVSNVQAAAASYSSAVHHTTKHEQVPR